MAPANRRRLGQRRNKLNAQYDQIQMLSNARANDDTCSDQAAWIKVAEKVTRDKTVLSDTKEAMQQTSVSLY